MTRIQYTKNFVTQQELARAYRDLGHSSGAHNPYDAYLLIDTALKMRWACDYAVPHDQEKEEEEEELAPPCQARHIIAYAGELPWPHLRPDEECWANLLAQHPSPTGQKWEQQAQMWGGTVEGLHRDHLRRTYLTHPDIGGMKKRNPTDVNFSPLVRDWETVAQALADFLDHHRPPKLTWEQRIMRDGLDLQIAKYDVQLLEGRVKGRVVREAARQRAEDGKLRRGFKSDVERWTGKSRTTLDTWYESPEALGS